jgi:hypothetical protein
MSETGRFYVKSLKTGKIYCVEPGISRTDWGSVDPATGEFRNKKGFKKYTGGIKEADSIIKPENGFVNIVTLQPGQSPLAYIEELDKQNE